MTYTLLTDAELSDLRANVLGLLPDTGVIYASTYASTGDGGGSITWNAVSGGTVSCRMDSLKLTQVDDRVIAMQERFSQIYQGSFPYDAPLAPDRRVVVGSVTYEIVVLYHEHSARIVRRAVLGALA